MNETNKKLLLAVIPILIALISFFFVSKYATSAQFHEKTIASLDEKKITVMELTAAATAASAAITLIPGDVGTPIADKLADVSSYFILVICAIYLEKYLLTITGYVTFVFMIPVGCVLLSISIFTKRKVWETISKKLIFFGLAIVLAVPASVKASDLIEATYETSINQTIQDAKQETDIIENNSKEQEEEDQSWWESLVSSAKNSVTNATTGLERVLNNMIEALAVMIVTSCVIPIIVLLFIVWLTKFFLNIDQKES